MFFKFNKKTGNLNKQRVYEKYYSTVISYNIMPLLINCQTPD